MFDDDDKELIYSIIDEKLTEKGQQKRQTNEIQNQEEDTQPRRRPTDAIVIVRCVEIITEDVIFIFKDATVIIF